MRYLGLLALLLGTYHKILLRKIDNPDSFVIVPVLQRIKSIGQYFDALWNYRTIDLQPMRDLTLYVDLYLNSLTGFETFVLQNIFWWVGVLYFLEKILTHLFKELSKNEIFIIVTLFAFYPLFSPVLSWGMSRKHILAMFFALALIEKIIRPEFKLNWKNSLSTAGLYTLSVLSQPITILLALWPGFYHFQKKPLKNLVLFSFPALIIMGFIIRFNYYYYETSQIFRFYYPAKTADAFNFMDKLLGVGHYFFQLFFPYQSSFYYTLGNPTVFVGIGLFIVFMYLGIKLLDKKTFANWLLLILMPLSIVLTMPPMISDSYLLLPSVGTLILLIFYLRNFKFSFHLKKVAPFFLVFWIGFDFYDSQNWISSYTLAKSSFERQPTCLTAFAYIRIGYESGLKAQPEAKKFLENYDCEIGDGSTAHNSITRVIFNSNVLYYEDDFPVQKRIDTLEKLSHVHFYAHLLQAALLIKEQRFKEADQTLSEFEVRWPDVVPVKQYIPAIAKVVHPYCLEKRFLVCEKLTKSFSYVGP